MSISDFEREILIERKKLFRKMFSATLKPQITSFIGRVHSRSVLEEIIATLAVAWKKRKHGIYRIENARSKEEVLSGARILQELTLLATRTYEGKPMTTGIVIGEKWGFERKPGRRWLRWLVMWHEHLRPSIENRDEFDAAAALADGRRSFMASDTFGRIYGIFETRNSDIDEVVRAIFGYGLITNRHREVFLFDGNIVPVCHHNGFEWRSGGYIGPVMWVDHWAHYEKEEPFYERMAQGDLSVSIPVNRDNTRWFAFQSIIESLSDRRLSSILVICDPSTLKNPDIQAILTPLRPELDNVKWGNINDNISVWANFFRLDGAHFVSKQMRILTVCQRISVPVHSKGTEGTGRAAAQFLSRQLDNRGVVIKVSADGPVTVFYKGQVVDEWIDLS